MVLKGRVKRRLETGETDYLLHNQKIKVCGMHHTREDAGTVADGGVKDEESETPAATGAKDPDTGTTKHIGDPGQKPGDPDTGAKDPDTGAKDPDTGAKDPDTGTTTGAAPAKSLEIQANTYTREVAQWLTSLTSKASEQGVVLPTILIDMCPSPQKPAIGSWIWYLGCPARVTPRCFDVR